MRANDRAAASRKHNALKKMTKRPFRLTYIDARRLCGVAGCDNTLLFAPNTRILERRLVRSGRTRGPTEASRAIHESNHESQTIKRGGFLPRNDRNILMLRRQDYRSKQSQFRRSHGRCKSDRLRHRVASLELHRSRRYDTGDGGAARLSQQSPYPYRNLELEQSFGSNC